MSKIVQFQDALKRKLIKEGDYFQTVVTQKSTVTVLENVTGYNEKQQFTAEQGELKLWRLVKVGKTAEECRLFGPPTSEILSIVGETGYKNAITTLDKIASETNIFPEFFKKVHSCRFSERRYDISSNGLSTTKNDVPDDEIKLHYHEDDKEMSYFIAALCENYSALSLSKVSYKILCKIGNYITSEPLCFAVSGFDTPSKPCLNVRPEAIPKWGLLIEMEARNGSKEKPWLCVENPHKTVELSQKELLKLIQEMQKEEAKEHEKRIERLSQLETFVRNLS